MSPFLSYVSEIIILVEEIILKYIIKRIPLNDEKWKYARKQV